MDSWFAIDVVCEILIFAIVAFLFVEWWTKIKNYTTIATTFLESLNVWEFYSEGGYKDIQFYAWLRSLGDMYKPPRVLFDFEVLEFLRESTKDLQNWWW